jgi:hypothetical protein
MRALLFTLLATQLAFTGVLGNTSGQKTVKRNNYGSSKKQKIDQRNTAEEEEYDVTRHLMHGNTRSLNAHAHDQCQLNIECKGRSFFF